MYTKIVSIAASFLIICFAISTIQYNLVNAQPVPTPKLSGKISDAGYGLALYHLKLAQIEKEKGNMTGYEYHLHLSGIQSSNVDVNSQDSVSNKTLRQIQNNLPNCIIENQGSGLCFETFK